MRFASSPRSTTWLFAAALSILPSCGGGKVLVVDGIEVYENHWERAKAELRGRASFDMSCQPEQLEFHLFRRVGRVPSEVGVQGCGRRDTYTKVGLTWFGSKQGAEAALEQQRIEQEPQRQEQQRQRQQQDEASRRHQSQRRY